ncbi:MAG: hypothetical protein HY744_06180 [Deltaproteobacteria bacterium]|nr:hypothetical protein [Deltaproteobacteria bacterium]
MTDTNRDDGAGRDVDRSGFTGILEALVGSCGDGVAAVLVDHEGESVDYAGALSPFDVKLAGAYWQIVLREARGCRLLGQLRELSVRTERLSFVVSPLHEGYCLVLVCGGRTSGGAPQAALQRARSALCREAGWPEDSG